MAWKECDHVSQRREFVFLASVEGANMSLLCERFGIARKTGYKWLARFRSEGEAALVDRSRRPHTFRQPTPAAIEQRVLAVRDVHPVWGGRKIQTLLRREGMKRPPAPSTITAILQRHGRIDPAESAKRQPMVRFERAEPNELWQIDFKGEFKMTNGHYCYPLTLLDDHSRFVVGLTACVGQRRTEVQGHLTTIFRRYGLPKAIVSDNGPPWATPHSVGRHTRLTAWLMQLDVQVIHARPYHPQTRGKQERFHRTLKAELLQGRQFDNLPHTQHYFDPWRDMYNHERPHEALDMAVPASRYRVSPRGFPEVLRPFEYAARFEVRKTNPVGQFSFRGCVWKTSEAFSKQQIGLCPSVEDGFWEVYYCHHRIGRLDLRNPERGVR